MAAILSRGDVEAVQGIYALVNWIINTNYVFTYFFNVQLNCGDIYQIWTWHSIDNQYFINLKNWENNRTEEIGLVTPIPVLLYCLTAGGNICQFQWKPLHNI